MINHPQIKKRRDKGISFKWLFVPIILCLFMFVSVFITIAPIRNYFPLYINMEERGTLAGDYSYHITMFHFIKEYGFNKVPNWYNGYYALLYYPVFYHLFFFLLFILLDDALLTVFLSIIILYLISMLGFILFGKLNKISFSKSLIFFVLFHFNYLMLVFGTIRIGRMAEFMGWTTFIFFSTIVFYYKNREIKLPFILFGLVNIIMLFSHWYVFVLANMLLFSLFLVKNKKEKIFIAGSWLLTFLLTLPWWLNFLYAYYSNKIALSDDYFGGFQHFLTHILYNPARRIMGMLLNDGFVVLFLMILFVYFKSLEKEARKKEFIFFSVPIIVAILYLFKLILLVPFFSKITYFAYVAFYLFLLLYLLFKIDMTKISKLAKLSILCSLQIIPILMFVYFMIFVHSFEPFPNPEIDQAQIELLKNVEGRILIIDTENFRMQDNLVSYAAAYFNINSSGGYLRYANTRDYINRFILAEEYIKESKCLKFREKLKDLNTTEVITYEELCDTLEKCNFRLKKATKYGCLFAT